MYDEPDPLLKAHVWTNVTENFLLLYSSLVRVRDTEYLMKRPFNFMIYSSNDCFTPLVKANWLFNVHGYKANNVSYARKSMNNLTEAGVNVSAVARVVYAIKLILICYEDLYRSKGIRGITKTTLRWEAVISQPFHPGS